MSDETVTWGEVCKKVQFADGLYGTCRDKIEGFDGFDGEGDEEEELYDPESFSDELAESSLPIPPPPPADWQPEGGFLSDLMEDGAWIQWLVFAAAAGGIWWLLKPAPQQVAVTETPQPFPMPGATTSRAA